MLRSNPICQYCGLEEASEVDHVVPLAAGGTNDYDNLRTSCKACHSRKTVIEDGGFGRRRAEKTA
jgi:5-methylcytosine-specific restriction protein A